MSVDGMRKLVWIAVAVLVAMTVFGIVLAEIDRASKSKPNDPPELNISIEATPTTDIWEWIHNQPQNTAPPIVVPPEAEVVMP
jgi:hypothetical protein